MRRIHAQKSTPAELQLLQESRHSEPTGDELIMTKKIFDKATEAMAGMAFEAGTTVREAFANTQHFSFTRQGEYSNVEVIECSVNVTPRLIEQAEALLERWRKP
jgi:hypothetical protein